MMRLGDMIKSLGTAEIEVCGARVRVRALSAAEHMALRLQCPDPPMRNGSDGKGGIVPDPMHPETVRLRAQRDGRRLALLVGAATGHEHPTVGAWRADLSPKDAGVYADDVLATCSPTVLDAVMHAETALSIGIDPSGKGDKEAIGTDTIAGN